MHWRDQAEVLLSEPASSALELSPVPSSKARRFLPMAASSAHDELPNGDREDRRCGVSWYGPEAQDWDALTAAGWEFLTAQARLERTTSHTELNTLLARRTGVREFDFGLDGERHEMGELLGQLSERSFTQAGLLISVLVH